MSALLDDPVTERKILDVLEDISNQLKLIRMHQEFITGQIIRVDELDED